MLNENIGALFSALTSQDNFCQYNISPFQIKHLNEYDNIIAKGTKHKNLEKNIYHRFRGKEFNLTKSGRDALNLILNNLNLCASDEIWIETTTNNFYISGCVTSTIEKYCGWSRKFSERTKAILINHEFGFTLENVDEYRKYNLPIIEDCAFSFLSENKSRSVGIHSDYVIISFPKFLPVPWGGGVYASSKLPKQNVVGENVLLTLVDFYIKDLDEIKKRRLFNYNLMAHYFNKEGFLARFEIQDGHVPGVFMFKHALDNNSIDSVKQHLNKSGIQSSVFYGEMAYFIPCHHEMTEVDVHYICSKTIDALTRFG
ncbi:DegT/DnrJ/EryC1/StrS family aminotransferase [Aeromonas rivipollensis]|uniref:DegT/DnrJ/EryC1/StrS family aminotransferase n=1 Tax=Aeromonas rivipollensis TaxID=948519 RepID=UPI0038E76A6A